MAPPKGQQPKTAKSASGHAKRQPSTAALAARPVVVPAIPLPMMQKQPNTTTNKSSKHNPTVSGASNGVPVSSLEVALLDHPPSQSAKSSGSVSNGFHVEKPERGHAAGAAAAAAAANYTYAQADDAPLYTNGMNGMNGVNGMNGADTRPSRHHATVDDPSQLSSAPSIADADSAVSSAALHDATQGAQDGQNQDENQNENQNHVSQPQSATSSSRPDSFSPYHMPPHPSGQQPPPIPADVYAAHPMHPHLHHRPHMSNGAIMFGGFPDSHTSSPAPPPTNFMPPPPPPPVNGESHMHPRVNGHHHAHTGSNGFPGPINTQFRPDMMPMSTIDSYGQVHAPVPQVPFEAFPPGLGRFGPPTPHSFHGSHASGDHNGGVENGAMPYPPNGLHYGSHAHHDPHHSVGHPHPTGPMPPFMHPDAFTRRPSLADDEMESIAYFRNQFNNGELADCVLELVYAKGHQAPVKITGHKLVLARSMALKQHIMAARATDLGSHTITIETDDAYLRSDAWWLAVQRLYLHPLLTLPPIYSHAANGVDFAGDKPDRFNFSLGYAAAGHILHMPDVLVRGLQIAANLLNWNTVEDALGFVLEGTTQRHLSYGSEKDEPNLPSVMLDFGYGPETKILLVAIMNFLVNEFPANFELDTSVADPPKFARIPGNASLPPPATTRPAPAIARGTSTRHPGKPTRLSSIKFGDLPAAYPEDSPAPHREPAKCSPILSRILLNLPFDELCEVLTSGSNGVSGWNTAQDRYHAVADVVAEREARRLRAVEAVRLGAVPHYLEIQHRLSAQRRHAIVELWDVLNWQEEVVQPRGAEVPRVVRKWVPQFAAVPEPPRQQVQSPSYEAHDSMV
ncbi:hypothetical protein F4809DRAFT_303950 [Biscogniauxia mediterranea]|nr:hypothetical protein F4809DRAFT_303950 [Biscogniauxia mediterranea]